MEHRCPYCKASLNKLKCNYVRSTYGEIYFSTGEKVFGYLKDKVEFYCPKCGKFLGDDLQNVSKLCEVGAEQK